MGAAPALSPIPPQERGEPEPGEATRAREPGAARRILVGIDASEPGQAVLAAATTLAERLRAELHGLFIEDGNLHKLAALPCAVELQLPTGAGRPLQVQALLGELRVLASGARQAVAAAAGRAQVGWSFEVRRGPLAATALAEAGELDLLLLPGTRRLRLRLSARPRRQSLRGERGAVFALFDESAGADRVLTVAACLAEGQERPLRVFSLASAPGAARRLQERAALWLSARGLSTEGLTLTGAGPLQVGAAVRAAGGGMLVLGCASPLLHPHALGPLQDALCGPLLLVK